jgi:hypothetical protein
MQHALRHFTQMGFTCPVRKDLPSFLLEITTPAGALSNTCNKGRGSPQLECYSSVQQQQRRPHA